MENEKINWFEKKWACVTPLVILIIFFCIYFFLQLSFGQSKIQFSPAVCKEHNTNTKYIAQCAGIDSNYIFKTAANPVDETGKLKEIEKDGKLTDTPSRKAMTERYNGRLLAMFMLAANVLFCFIAFLVFFFLLEKLLNYKYAIGFITGSILLGFTVGLSDSIPLMGPVLKKTIGELAGGIAGIFDVVKVVNSIAQAGTMAFILTVCVILFVEKSDTEVGAAAEAEYLAKPVEEKSESEAEDSTASDEKKESEKKASILDSILQIKLQNIANRKEDLETLLYMGTLLLIIGVLRMNTMSNWASTFMTPESAESAKTFFVHLTTVVGGFYTLLLAAAYLPAIYILQQRGKTLLDKAVKDNVKPPETFEKKDFMFSLKDSLPRIFAIMAPFLTGPIAELIKKMSGN